MVKYEATGIQGRYVNGMRTFGYMLIDAAVRKGVEYVLLTDLYEAAEANTPALQNGIQWAVRDAKEDGLISSVKKHRGLYKVNA